MRLRLLLVLALLVPSLLAGCGELGALRGALAASPHEAYDRALDDAGLGATALAAAWRAAAADALARPVEAEVPLAEVAYFDPARPEAAGYRFALRRGDRLRVRLTPQPGDTARVFLDLFAAPDSLAPGAATRSPDRVAGADAAASPDSLAFTFEPDRDGAFVLRVQPELLRGGRVRVEARTEPRLAVFPVSGVGREAIRSFWGADRDGGARRHEGIDIFAPRGTPAVAVADGVATLREGGLGGKTVWLRTGRLSLYYAHLDSQLVAHGQRVAAGDTLGWVGNTGNARSTPPHLHFGIYGFGGATDPLPFVDRPRPDPPAVRADTATLGQWARLTAAGDLGPAGTPVRLGGASGGRYRALAPDGAVAYVDEARVSTRPLRTAPLAGVALRGAPSDGAPVVDSVAVATVEVLGIAGGFTLVRTEEGREGWMREG